MYAVETAPEETAGTTTVLGPDFPPVLARVRDGDERAFADLWRCYQPVVLRYLTVLVGESADDVASETWIAVVRSLHQFSGNETNFRTWLMTIARHRAMDWGRARQRHPVVLQDEEQLSATAPPEPDTATVVLGELSARSAVRTISTTLPPLQAEAVILRSVVGLDVPEVARIMGKRAGAVRVLAHRGLRTLEKLFARTTSEDLT
jgi:RNA polymerase sigma-70 factor (ECF subfamily)